MSLKVNIDLNGKTITSIDELADVLKKHLEICDCNVCVKRRKDENEAKPDFKIWEGVEKAKEGEFYFRLTKENHSLVLSACDHNGITISYILAFDGNTQELVLNRDIDEKLPILLNSDGAPIIGGFN